MRADTDLQVVPTGLKGEVPHVFEEEEGCLVGCRANLKRLEYRNRKNAWKGGG